MCKAVHELTCESLGLIFPWFQVQLELFPMVPSQIKSRNHTDSFILLPKYNPYKQYLLWLDLNQSHGKNSNQTWICFPWVIFTNHSEWLGLVDSLAHVVPETQKHSWNPWICAHHFRPCCVCSSKWWMYCISCWWHAHYGKGACGDDMYEGRKCWLLWDQGSGQSTSLLQLWNHSGQISPYHHSGTELLFHHMVCKSSQVLHSCF